MTIDQYTEAVNNAVHWPEDAIKIAIEFYACPQEHQPKTIIRLFQFKHPDLKPGDCRAVDVRITCQECTDAKFAQDPNPVFNGSLTPEELADELYKCIGMENPNKKG